MRINLRNSLLTVLSVFIGVSLLSPAGAVLPARAQGPTPTPQAAPVPNLVVGPLVKVDGQNLTVKNQQGAEITVTLTDVTKLLQIAPGQKNLSGATPIELKDIAPGDRLLVRLQPSDDASGPKTAIVVIAMKQADIAQQHAAVQAAWQHGVGGLVKEVDPASQSIVITTNGLGHPKTMTIKLGPSTIVKRYAAESVEYEKAQVSSVDKIMVGDQLRARGKPDTDPTIFEADEVVAGSFRNISGKITAVDATSGMVSLTDLATKQTVQLKVTGDSQLRKFDDATAERLAAAMKPAGDSGAGAKPGGGATGGGAPAPGAPGGPPAGAAAGGASSSGSSSGAGGSWHRGAGGAGSGSGDMQSALAHAAPVQLSELKKGDIVMAVASSGVDNQLGAVTLVTGVEPLLRASPSASAAVLSSWSLGAGAGGGGDQ